jgi:hypothetical protein
MINLPKEKRDKLAILALGTGAVLALLYFFVVAPQKAALREYAQKTDAARDKLAKAEMWHRMAPAIEAQLTAQRRELETRHESLAPVDRFKWFYNTLEAFLAQHRVQLVDITREPEIGSAGVLPAFPYQAATFGVKCRARFHDFGAFLAEFENHFPYMRVQNLELEPQSGGSSPPREVRTTSTAPTAQALNITLRVVTLIKPNNPW